MGEDLNALELGEIDQSINTSSDFTKRYGTYMIIGFEYGGEIVYKSSLETRTTEDHAAVSGALKGVFSAAGFSVAKGKAKYNTEDLAKGFKAKTDFYINPELPDLPGDSQSDIQVLVKALNELGTVSGSKSVDEGLSEKVAKTAQMILSDRSSLSQTTAILWPLLSIPAVAEKFNILPDDTPVHTAFNVFVNDMYIEAIGVQKKVKLITEDYQTFDPNAQPVAVRTWSDWIYNLVADFEKLTPETLNAARIDWNEHRHEVHTTDPVMDATSFTRFKTEGLRKQFYNSVLAPYESWLEEQGNGDYSLCDRSGDNLDDDGSGDTQQCIE